MENENMMYEDEIMINEVENDEVETDNSGMSAGVAVLIGAGLAAAGVAVVTLGKKAYAKFKARKEFRKPDDDDCIEVTDEDLMDVVE